MPDRNEREVKRSKVRADIASERERGDRIRESNEMRDERGRKKSSNDLDLICSLNKERERERKKRFAERRRKIEECS